MDKQQKSKLNKLAIMPLVGGLVSALVYTIIIALGDLNIISILGVVLMWIAGFLPIIGLFMTDKKQARDAVFGTVFSIHTVAFIFLIIEPAIIMNDWYYDDYDADDWYTIMAVFVSLIVIFYVINIVLDSLYEGLANAKVKKMGLSNNPSAASNGSTIKSSMSSNTTNKSQEELYLEEQIRIAKLKKELAELQKDSKKSK